MGQQLPAGECLREGADWLPAAPSLGGGWRGQGSEWPEARETDHNSLHFHAKNINDSDKKNKRGHHFLRCPQGRAHARPSADTVSSRIQGSTVQRIIHWLHF